MTPPLHLFEGFGVELEYMIVDRGTLDVRPITDEVLKQIAGVYTAEVERGELRWSNELVLHVIELKTNGPAATLAGLSDVFQRDVETINALLAPAGAMLMPTAMHPWMNPHTQTVLWPHEYSPVYAAFDRIFSCQGHGWSNVQSTHLNLPFADDEEFGRLHAAIRLVLPILPALAASSPIVDGRRHRMADARLEFYRHNARRIPAVTGRVIPEDAASRREYEERILEPLYRAIAPHDPGGVLQYEWLNARGAIARFERSTIEIRLLDIQECPRADVAVLQLVVGALRALVAEEWAGYDEQRAFPLEPLEAILLRCIERGDRAPLDAPAYAAAFGLRASSPTAIELWQHLYDACISADDTVPTTETLRAILSHGCLARRIAASVGEAPTHAQLMATYAELCDCLRTGRLFGVA